jgi:hypothetical protein
MEEWRTITDFPNYQVSSLGNVRNIPKGETKCLPHERTDGYVKVWLKTSEKSKGKTMRVHQLVAQAFLPRPDEYRYVIHLDKDKTNNRVENLEWRFNFHDPNMRPSPTQPQVKKPKPLPEITEEDPSIYNGMIELFK